MNELEPKKGPISVIEIRRATNGYVVSAFMEGFFSHTIVPVKGYATYLVASDDPADVAKAVDQALRDWAITSEVIIPPARTVP